MRNLKTVALAIVAGAILAACGSTEPAQRPATASNISLLTADQVAVLAGDTDDSVVRDAVDGGKVVSLK